MAAYRAIASRLHTFILSDDYVFHAPEYHLWGSLVEDADASERDRLEFFGDKILHMLTATELRTLYPQATAGFYTVISQAVNSNNVFSLLMNKGKLLKNSGKTTADAFETMVAALYTQGGFKITQKWFRAQFTPLLFVSKKAFDQWAKSRPNAKRKARKRSTALANAKASPIALALSAKKRALRNHRLSSRTPSRVPGRKTLHKTPLRTPARNLGLITPAKPTIEIIDLTNVSDDGDDAGDWEDDEEPAVPFRTVTPIPKKTTSESASSSSHMLDTFKRLPHLRSLVLRRAASPVIRTPSKSATVTSPLRTSFTAAALHTPILGSSLRPITIDDSDSE